MSSKTLKTAKLIYYIEFAASQAGPNCERSNREGEQSSSKLVENISDSNKRTLM